MKTEQTQTFDQAVEKIVKFWIEKSFRITDNQDSSNGGLGNVLMNMNSVLSQKSITEEKIKIFESELTRLVKAMQGKYIYIGVDYHPYPILADAATKAQIDTGCFPWKSCTWINKDNTVDSRFGYEGDIVRL